MSLQGRIRLPVIALEQAWKSHENAASAPALGGNRKFQDPETSRLTDCGPSGYQPARCGISTVAGLAPGLVSVTGGVVGTDEATGSLASRTCWTPMMVAAPL